MQIIGIYGHSDDLVEIERVDKVTGMPLGADEVTPPGSDDGIVGVLNVGGKLRVYCIYKGACWSFAPALIEEGFPIPEDWIVMSRSGGVPLWKNGAYSMLLTIECPDDVRVFLEGAKE